MKIFDISPLIHPGLAVFPGDTIFQRKVLMDTDSGDHIGLSSVTTTLHLGAHTDAPNHYAPRSVGIDQVNLETYLGPAQVIDCTKVKEEIGVDDIDLKDITAPRILFKTNSFPNADQWTDKFSYISALLIQKLHEKGVRLVGIDTPSIDHATSKDLPAHSVIAKNAMAILEGIVLKDIQPGNYTLIALPLRIKDADASPVRAVLIQDSL